MSFRVDARVLWIISLLLLVSCGGGGSGGDTSGDSYGTNTPTSGTGYGTTSTTNTTSTTSDSAAFAATNTYTVTLSGAQQVPRVRGTNTLQITVEIDATNNKVRSSFSTSNIGDYSMAHIHSGSVGQNGGIIIAYQTDSYDDAKIDEATVTPEEIAGILAGDSYVNIHTTSFPDGQYRGQIVPATTRVLTFELNGRQQSPRVISDGRGEGYASIDQAGQLTLRTHFYQLQAPNAVHLHQGSVGNNGDVVIAMEQDPDAATGWQLPADTTLDANTTEALLTGGHYVNAHTSDYPNGELRGQVMTKEQQLITFELDGGQQVPAVISNASGDGYALVNSDTGNLQLTVNVAGISDVSMAHIHQGVAGTNGDVVIELASSSEDGSQWSTPANSVIDGATLAILLSGGHYVNIHSQSFADGEIRGQIVDDSF